MCLRLLRKDSCRHRQAHHIMLHLRCGETNLTTAKVTSGVLVVYCKKCVHSNPHLGPRICRVYNAKFSEANIQKYQQYKVTN